MQTWAVFLLSASPQYLMKHSWGAHWNALAMMERWCMPWGKAEICHSSHSSGWEVQLKSSAWRVYRHYSYHRARKIIALNHLTEGKTNLSFDCSKRKSLKIKTSALVTLMEIKSCLPPVKCENAAQPCRKSAWVFFFFTDDNFTIDEM